MRGPNAPEYVQVMVVGLPALTSARLTMHRFPDEACLLFIGGCASQQWLLFGHYSDQTGELSIRRDAPLSSFLTLRLLKAYRFEKVLTQSPYSTDHKFFLMYRFFSREQAKFK